MRVFYILLLNKTLICICRRHFPCWQPINPEDDLSVVVLSTSDALEPGTPIYAGLRVEERRVGQTWIPVQAPPPTSCVTEYVVEP